MSKAAPTHHHRHPTVKQALAAEKKIRREKFIEKLARLRDIAARTAP